jgi:hypothetical protein
MIRSRNGLALGLSALAGLATMALTTPSTILSRSGATPAAATMTVSALPVDHGSQAVCAGVFAALGCQAQIATAGPDSSTALRSGKPIGWGANDLRAAYHLPATSPHRGTVAVISAGPYPSLSSDLAVYRAQYALPACTSATGCLRQIDYQGGPALPPPPDAEKAGAQRVAVETALDVDMVSATCPACRLLEVQVPLDKAPKNTQQASDYEGYAAAFATAVQTAIAAGADAITISFAMPGDAQTLRGPIAQALDHRGVPITAPAGDFGFNGNGYAMTSTIPGFTGRSAVWPQALPTVISVGGTTMVAQGGRYTQGAWSLGGSGCTPGVTPPEGQPSWIARLCPGGRASTDVSAVADNIAMYDSYHPADNDPAGWLVEAGTSAAGPQIAGLYVDGGHLGDVDGPNTLYRAPASAFSDVTSGTNLVPPYSGTDGSCSLATEPNTDFSDRLCAAMPAWDGPTGLGTPQGLGAF